MRDITKNTFVKCSLCGHVGLPESGSILGCPPIYSCAECDALETYLKIEPVTLDLVLSYYWFDKIRDCVKEVEYRKMTPHWERLIWKRRDQLTHVRFRRGYTSMALTRDIAKIDIGTCPYYNWDGDYYRIHFDHPKIDA